MPEVPAKPEDVIDLANRMPTGSEMMDSRWQNAECEEIVWQTIRAAKTNYKAGKGLYSILNLADGYGVRNSEGYSRLLDDGCFIEGKKGKKTIITPTQTLVDIVRGHLAGRKNK